MKTESNRIGHLDSIDFLRGIASLAVVIGHIGHGLSQGSNNTFIKAMNHVMSYGSIGVPLFFVLSGFCIHRKKAEQLFCQVDEPVSFIKYWKRRFYRLYPSYFVVCLGSALIMLLTIKLNIPSVTVDQYPGNAYMYLGLDLLTHLLMIHCFFSYFDGGLGNGALWTLAREEQYYLLYFPVLKIRKYFGVWSCLLLSIAVSLLIFQFSNQVKSFAPEKHRIVLYSSLLFWPQWILGLVSVEVVAGLINCREAFQKRIAMIAGVLLIILAFEFANYHFWLQQMTLGAGFFILITHITSRESLLGWPTNKILRLGQFVGTYSYSLYLIHSPFMLAITKIGRSLGSANSTPKFIILAIFCFFFAQIPAYLLYYYVERHGQSTHKKQLPILRHEIGTGQIDKIALQTGEFDS